MTRLVPILLCTAALAAPEKPHRVHGVAWHRTLDAAQEAAGGRKARPIVWLRMLGDLAGKT